MALLRRFHLTLTVLVAALVVPHGLAAQDLAAFEGNWRGVSVDGPEGSELEPQSFELQIRPVQSGGFAAGWSNPLLPDVENVEEEMDARLRPTGRPGVFAVEEKAPSFLERWFSSPASGNPLERQTLLWARVGDDSLTLYSLSIDSKGHPAMIHTTYLREGEELAFEREARFQAEDPIVIRGRLARGG